MTHYEWEEFINLFQKVLDTPREELLNSITTVDTHEQYLVEKTIDYVQSFPVE